MHGKSMADENLYPFQFENFNTNTIYINNLEN